MRSFEFAPEIETPPVNRIHWRITRVGSHVRLMIINTGDGDIEDAYRSDTDSRPHTHTHTHTGGEKGQLCACAVLKRTCWGRAAAETIRPSCNRLQCARVVRRLATAMDATAARQPLSSKCYNSSDLTAIKVRNTSCNLFPSRVLIAGHGMFYSCSPNKFVQSRKQNVQSKMQNCDVKKSKLVTIFVTRCQILRLKCTISILARALSQAPPGELAVPPRHIS